MLQHYQLLKDTPGTTAKPLVFLLPPPHYYNDPIGKKFKKNDTVYLKCIMLLKPKHLWKGFLCRKARGWQHQLQTGRKWRENIHYCFSPGSISLLFLAYWSSPSEQKRQTLKRLYYLNGLLYLKHASYSKNNFIGRYADQSLNTAELQKCWQPDN